jgi:aryl-alcohol dehydrogenase-like predicted oxidoreductase
MRTEMPYHTLGHTGEKVSAIGLGGWHLSRKGVSRGTTT